MTSKKSINTSVVMSPEMRIRGAGDKLYKIGLCLHQRPDCPKKNGFIEGTFHPVQLVLTRR